MKTTMRVIIFSFLMLGLVSGQDLPQPAIVGEDLIQPTLKISEFVKVDENTGIKDDRVTLGIRQLLEESFSNSRYILVEDDNANFVVSAEVVYIGRPNEAFSIVGLFNRRNSKTQVNMVISIKDNQTGKVKTSRGQGEIATRISAAGLQISEDIPFNRTELGGAVRQANDTATKNLK